MRRSALVAIVAGLSSGSCSAPLPLSPPPAAQPARVASTAPAEPPAPALAVAGPGPPQGPADERRDEVLAMLARVAAARGLPLRRPVHSLAVERRRAGELIRAHVAAELPMSVVVDQGESLAALGLVPADYDFVEGMFALVEGRIAGFYEPADQTMYLVADLSRDEADETLAHELVHALQDQSFPLTPLLKFVPGDGDRLSAVHAVVEGDATSAMLDVMVGSAFKLSEPMLRRVLDLSTAASAVGITTPHALRASLTAPYIDGFAFVQAQRKRGGWAAVDQAYARLPETTEQLLHLDKYDQREPAIPVAAPPASPLGAGFQVVFEDVMGEEGLRIVLEDWTGSAEAAAGAAGWGGDRYVIAARDAGAPGKREVALGWHLRFDTAADTREAAAILAGKLGRSCVLRSDLGPITWKAQARDLALAAGPYLRDGKSAKATGTCAQARAWVDAMLR